MRKFLFALFVFISSLGSAQSDYDDEMETVARLMNAAVQASGKERIAVVDFTDPNGRGNDLGNHIAEDLRYWLLQYKGDYILLERSALNKVLEEQRLSSEAVFDEQNAIELGKLMSADAIVFGTVNVEGRRGYITTRLIDTETGALLSMERAEVKLRRTTASEYDESTRWMKRDDQMPVQKQRSTSPYRPFDIFTAAGVQRHFSAVVPTFGANISFRGDGGTEMVNGERTQVPSRRAFTFGLHLHQYTSTLNNRELTLGYREVLDNFDDSNGISLTENGEGITAGDVYVLAAPDPEFENYILPFGLSSARLVHTQLSDIRVSNLYMDLWYKYYLTQDYFYTNTFNPYVGLGLALNVLMTRADYTGTEALFQQTGGAASDEYTVTLSSFNDNRFPFDGFSNTLTFLDWNLYVGFEKGRFGVQTTWGVISQLGGSPLVLPYLNDDYTTSRELERRLEEDAVFIYSEVLPTSNGTTTSVSTSSADNFETNPFLERFTAMLRVTFKLY
jgi:TolB-like protein